MEREILFYSKRRVGKVFQVELIIEPFAQDMINDSPENGDIGTRPDLCKDVGLGRGPCIPRVNVNYSGSILLRLIHPFH